MTPDAHTPPLQGLWLSISDLAARNGVTKQTMAAKVTRFESQGLLSTRTEGKGRPKLVNVAAFDVANGQAGDAIKALAAQGRADAPPAAASPAVDDGNPVLAKEQARRTQYQADLAEIELRKARGDLVPAADVTAAMVRCAEMLVRQIDQMPARADDLASAVAKDGTTGARAWLKSMARELRAALAQEMRMLETDGSAVPEDDEE